MQAKLSCSEITFVHWPCPDFFFVFFLSRQSKLSECGTHSRRAQLHGAEAKISDSVWIQVFNKDGTKRRKSKDCYKRQGLCVGGSSRTNDWEAAVAVLLCTFHSPASRDSSLCIFARIYNEAGDQHAGRALRGLPHDEHRSVKSNLASIKQQISK